MSFFVIIPSSRLQGETERDYKNNICVFVGRVLKSEQVESPFQLFLSCYNISQPLALLTVVSSSLDFREATFELFIFFY